MTGGKHTPQKRFGLLPPACACVGEITHNFVPIINCLKQYHHVILRKADSTLKKNQQKSAFSTPCVVYYSIKPRVACFLACVSVNKTTHCVEEWKEADRPDLNQTL